MSALLTRTAAPSGKTVQRDDGSPYTQAILFPRRHVGAPRKHDDDAIATRNSVADEANKQRIKSAIDLGADRCGQSEKLSQDGCSGVCWSGHTSTTPCATAQGVAETSRAASSALAASMIAKPAIGSLSA